MLSIADGRPLLASHAFRSAGVVTRVMPEWTPLLGMCIDKRQLQKHLVYRMPCPEVNSPLAIRDNWILAAEREVDAVSVAIDGRGR